MAIRPIEILGSEVLRTPAHPVDSFDEGLQELVRDMYATMYHAQGIGLAAPQVGVSLRVLVLDVPDRSEDEDDADVEGSERVRHRLALVNPRLVSADARTARAPEGCLSIPGLEEVVERPVRVVVEGLDPQGRPLRVEAERLLARALQHEMDHLEGILFIDRVSPLKRRMLLKKWRKVRAEEAEAPR